MSQNNLHLHPTLDTRSLKISNPRQRRLRLLLVSMHAAEIPLRICPLRNVLLARKEPPIVARVSHKIDPPSRCNSRKQIDVAREMARCVDHVDGAVAHQVVHPEIADPVPVGSVFAVFGRTGEFADVEAVEECAFKVLVAQVAPEAALKDV